MGPFHIHRLSRPCQTSAPATRTIASALTVEKNLIGILVLAIVEIGTSVSPLTNAWGGAALLAGWPSHHLA